MKRKSRVKAKNDEGSLSFASLLKLLASTDEKMRNRALRAVLTTWLPSQSQIPEGDMRKLWKGLFYCFWHSDKSAVQARLADRLSSIMLDLPVSLSMDFFSAFLLTMRREWGGIDFLRLDKFYLLIRRFLRNIFAVLRKHCWDKELVDKVVWIIMERTFLDTENSRGNGVNYHVASVFLEEFKCYLPLRKEVVITIFVPFVGVMGKVADKILLGKLKTSLFDELLKAGRKFIDAKGGDAENDDATLLGPIGLGLQLSAMLYELGASSECIQGNRKLIFELHDSFSKLEKDLESSGIEFTFPDKAASDDDEEAPLLVPIDPSVLLPNGCNGEEKNHVHRKKKKSSARKGRKSNNKSNDESQPLAENGDALNSEQLVKFTESVILNLQKQFDKVANGESAADSLASCCSSGAGTTGDEKVGKKRKRAKSKAAAAAAAEWQPEITAGRSGTSNGDASACKSVKKVRFSMKNNLVWKPHSPLPPQDLRIPPSVTPRGSALKKGVPPGPIREMPPATKSSKGKAKFLKKRRNGLLAVTPIRRIIKKPKPIG